MLKNKIYISVMAGIIVCASSVQAENLHENLVGGHVSNFSAKNTKDNSKLSDPADPSTIQSINTNSTNISTNSTNISTNSTNISTNSTNISTNSTNISTNSTNISTNTAGISTNSTNISTNTAGINTIVGGGTINGHHVNGLVQDEKNIAQNTQSIKDLDRKTQGIEAMNTAESVLFQPYGIGHFNFSMGFGAYESVQAVAVGVGYRFNEHFAARLNLADALGGKGSQNNPAAGVGIDVEF